MVTPMHEPIESRTDLKAMLLSEIEEIFLCAQETSYRARHVFRAVHRSGVNFFDDIVNLKSSTRNFLSNNFNLLTLKMTSTKCSDDGTRKYQFATHDNHTIESVFIPYAAKHGRHTLCISSQVGCAMGCTFCATAALKLVRNLTASEIVSQVYLVSQDVVARGDNPALILQPNERTIHNIVFMGMGEPLHNFDHVVRAIKLLTHPDGMAFAPHRITVSTSGLVPKIVELGEETGVCLAISLNATTDDVRNVIMPVNQKWRIEKLLGAARKFPRKIRERLLFEYVLLKGVNDSVDDAMRLAHLLKDMHCKVNLIPFNEHPFSPHKRPDKEEVAHFYAILSKANQLVTIRKTRGDDIDAACGMLGAKKLESERHLTAIAPINR